LLKGLKPYAHPREGPGHRLLPPKVDITAIVTVTDDGGSSGRLRREFEVLPPGDIRNCIVALSEDEGLLSLLFQYRFDAGRGLKGHSFGNLFLTALTQLTGDFAHAVKVSSEVLAIVGRIYPATAEDVVLEAVLEDGSTVTGESLISKSRLRIREIRLNPQRPKPIEETLTAIAEADLISLIKIPQGLDEGMGTSALLPSIAVLKQDDAIADISTSRVNLGAIQNRLEHTIENLETSSENLTVSESRIRDADMAQEMVGFTRNNRTTSP